MYSFKFLKYDKSKSGPKIFSNYKPFKSVIDVERHLGHNMLSMNTRDISKVMIAIMYLCIYRYKPTF